MRTGVYDTTLALSGQGITTYTTTHIIHRAERAVVSFSLIVMALILAFSAGSAVGFAVQDQMAKKKEHRLEVRLDQVTASVDTITANSAHTSS